jgi:CRISPR-associated protein Csd1
MSWIQQLVKTYDNCTAAIGVQTAAEGENEKVPLLPIAHTTYKAQVEITLDQNGNFLGAEIVPKSEARTIIPCTESSGGRTSDKTPHPLCDKLQYVAKDYSTWAVRKNPVLQSTLCSFQLGLVHAILTRN